MPTFSYSARSRAGERVDGQIDAPDRKSALAKVESMSYLPIAVKEATSATATGKATKAKSRAKAKGTNVTTKAKTWKFQLERRGKTKMKLRETLIFARELRDLLSSGMNLGEALNSLARRETGSGSDYIMKRLKEDIVQGSALSDALAKHPESFATFFVNMIRAGEASGQLTEALDNVSSHYERMIEAREKVTMALVYPCIILLIGGLTVVFCMLFVIPRFKIIFEDLDSTLPLPTQMLISTSEIMTKYGLVVAGVFVLFIVLFKRAIKTPNGRYKLHNFLLRVPILNDLIRANAFAHFSRTLGGLLKNGVPVLTALKIVEDTVGNDVISEQIRGARDRVTDGASISRPLEESGVFPSTLTDMLKVGEQSGNVPGALEHISKRYDDELNRSVKIFTTVLEPIMMLGMAIIVGFIAISMLLAVFEMTNGLDI